MVKYQIYCPHCKDFIRFDFTHPICPTCKKTIEITFELAINQLYVNTDDIDNMSNQYALKVWNNIKDRFMAKINEEEDMKSYFNGNTRLMREFLMYKLNSNYADGNMLHCWGTHYDGEKTTPLGIVKDILYDWMDALIEDSIDDFGGTMGYFDGFKEDFEQRGYIYTK